MFSNVEPTATSTKTIPLPLSKYLKDGENGLVDRLGVTSLLSRIKPPAEYEVTGEIWTEWLAKSDGTIRSEGCFLRVSLMLSEICMCMGYSVTEGSQFAFKGLEPLDVGATYTNDSGVPKCGKCDQVRMSRITALSTS